MIPIFTTWSSCIFDPRAVAVPTTRISIHITLVTTHCLTQRRLVPVFTSLNTGMYGSATSTAGLSSPARYGGVTSVGVLSNIVRTGLGIVRQDTWLVPEGAIIWHCWCIWGGDTSSLLANLSTAAAGPLRWHDGITMRRPRGITEH